jgi:hypothetical protein
MPNFPKPDPAVSRLLNEGLVDRGLSSGIHVQKDPRWERVLRVQEGSLHVRCEGRVMGRITSTGPGRHEGLRQVRPVPGHAHEAVCVKRSGVDLNHLPASL